MTTKQRTKVPQVTRTQLNPTLTLVSSPEAVFLSAEPVPAPDRASVSVPDLTRAIARVRRHDPPAGAGGVTDAMVSRCSWGRLGCC